MKARDVMTVNLYTLAPSHKVKDAAKIIADKNVGSVLVVKEGKLVGIFTERDLAKLVAKGVSLDTPLSEVMTKNVHTVHADDPLVKAVYFMVEYNIRHVPVVDAEGKPIGIISARDILRNII
jgi:CBS domain-containing protein